MLLATRKQHQKFLEEANILMILKPLGILGPSKEHGDVQEVRVLNRILSYVQPPFGSGDQGYITWEEDPRHVEILMSSLGLTEPSKPLGQPGAKLDKAADLTLLNEAAKATYRSNVMRLGYLAQDRPDIQYVAKERARQLNAPTVYDENQLKRAVRYLKGVGRIVQEFKQQARPDGLTVFSDSDFAGCVRTRRSTSCTMVFYGLHLLRSSSTTQAIVSLSSGEAEFYSAVKAASLSLGMSALYKDMGVQLKAPIRLRVDSTACIGMAGRKGAGKVRHIHTPTLWLQQAIGKKLIDQPVIRNKLANAASILPLGPSPNCTAQVGAM